MEVHLFNISVFFRHLKFTQNFIWQLDRDEAGVREGDGHLTGGDRPRSRGEGERKRERERVRGWGGEEGLRVEGWRGWETDGDSALAASPRGNKQQIWDLSHREKEMEIRKREGEWSAEKMIFLFFLTLRCGGSSILLFSWGTHFQIQPSSFTENDWSAPLQVSKESIQNGTKGTQWKFT